MLTCASRNLAPGLGVEAKGGRWTWREKCQSRQGGLDLLCPACSLEIPGLMCGLVCVGVHPGAASQKCRGAKLTPFYYSTVSVGPSSGQGLARSPAPSVLTGDSCVPARPGPQRRLGCSWASEEPAPELTCWLSEAGALRAAGLQASGARWLSARGCPHQSPERGP